VRLRMRIRMSNHGMTTKLASKEVDLIPPQPQKQRSHHQWTMLQEEVMMKPTLSQKMMSVRICKAKQVDPIPSSAETEKSSSVSDTEYGYKESDFHQQDDDDAEDVNCAEDCADMGEQTEGESNRPHPPSDETEKSSAVSDTEYAARESDFDSQDKKRRGTEIGRSV
jgi:hypothetical protein